MQDTRMDTVPPQFSDPDAALRVACAAARLGVWRWDAVSGLHAWSQALCALFAVTLDPSGFTSAALLDAVDPADRDGLAASLADLPAATDKVSLAFRIRGKDGETRHCLCSGTPVRTPQGVVLGVEGFCQEVTALREAEAARLAADRLAAISQLTGGLAHDFNNVLTVISLNLEIAADMLEADDPLQEMLRPAIKATTDGSALTGRLLTFARRKPLRPAPHDVNALVGRIGGQLRERLPARQALVVDLQPGTGFCQIDPAGLELALRSLVDNSSQAMTEGGSITLRTTRVTLSDAQARKLPPLAAGQYVQISVADTGPGIPPSRLPHVVEPFFTTRKGVRAAGLGLNLVLGFADQSGGHMALDSTEGRGTEVRLLLPALDAR